MGGGAEMKIANLLGLEYRVSLLDEVKFVLINWLRFTLNKVLESYTKCLTNYKRLLRSVRLLPNLMNFTHSETATLSPPFFRHCRRVLCMSSCLCAHCAFRRPGTRPIALRLLTKSEHCLLPSFLRENRKRGNQQTKSSVRLFARGGHASGNTTRAF